MRIEDTTNHFANTLILVAGIFPYLEDDFFVKKLRAKIEIFISGYIRFESREEDTSIAQYYLIGKLISDTDDILEILELISHLGIIKKIAPLLLASRSLLVLKLEILKTKNNLAISLKNKEDSAPVIIPKLDNKDQASVVNIVTSQKNIKQKLELNPSKEKILNFIKKSPNARPKDIIHEFNALSDRTVKRNLGELLRVGLINKKIENKAVYYSAEN